MINGRAAVSLLALALVAVVGCVGATPAMAPSATVTTTVQGWENWFALDWATYAKPSGNEIAGYVYNKYGQAAVNVRILAQGLDQNGALVDQKLAWVPGDVPPLNRAYFRVPGLPTAQQYRVTVWAFDFIQGAGDAFH